jgi:hypothetical protein
MKTRFESTDKRKMEHDTTVQAFQLKDEKNINLFLVLH